MMHTKGDLNAKSELALMGRPVQVTDPEELKYCFSYIANVLKRDETGEEIYNEAVKYINLKETKPIGFCCNTLFGYMRVITIIMKDIKAKHFSLADEDGVLCHVHNFTCPDCSELGYCFFEKLSNGGFRRIG